MDTILWGLRIAIIAVGSGATAVLGWGDASMWEAVAAAVVALVGAVWSWRARQAALMAEPPR